MAVHTYEGVIENGQIKLSTPIEFAEHAKVVVTVADKDPHLPADIVLPPRDPSKPIRMPIRIMSPRLADPSKAHLLRRPALPLDNNDTL